MGPRKPVPDHDVPYHAIATDLLLFSVRNLNDDDMDVPDI